MSIREDLTLALSGGAPETVPLSVYQDFFMHWPGVLRNDPGSLTRHPGLRQYLDMGLGLTWDTGVVEYIRHGAKEESRDRLKAEVQARCARAGPAGLAFEISEDLPANWRETVPLVLEALREVRRPETGRRPHRTTTDR